MNPPNVRMPGQILLKVPGIGILGEIFGIVSKQIPRKNLEKKLGIFWEDALGIIPKRIPERILVRIPVSIP